MKQRISPPLGTEGQRYPESTLRLRFRSYADLPGTNPEKLREALRMLALISKRTPLTPAFDLREKASSRWAHARVYHGCRALNRCTP